MHVNSTCEEQKQERLCKVQPKNHWLMSDNNGAFYCLIKMCVEFDQDMDQEMLIFGATTE